MAKEKTFDDMIDHMEALTVKIRKRTAKTVRQMAAQLKKEVVKNSSVADEHTPLWLKRAGHPYAGRPPIPHRAPLVHRVSGTLSDNIEIFEGERSDELQVGVSTADVPYAEYVINGTTKMIARDFLSYSLIKMNKRFRKKVAKDFKKSLKDNRDLDKLSTKGAFNNFKKGEL